MPAMNRFPTAAIVAFLIAPNARAQMAPSTEPAMMAARMASGQLKMWITKAASQMDEADYAFRPTSAVRSFGQIIAHIADQNYIFCSAAKGETGPVTDIEKTKTSREDILRAMNESMRYCDEVYAATTDERARTSIKFMSAQMPVAAVLLFRTHHNSLHYGNIVTYMRLRGKVPPSTAGMP